MHKLHAIVPLWGGGLLLCIRCNDTDNCDAADTPEPSAAFVQFQRG